MREVRTDTWPSSRIVLRTMNLHNGAQHTKWMSTAQATQHIHGWHSRCKQEQHKQASNAQQQGQ